MVTAMLPYFSLIDEWVAGFLPLGVRICLWGLLSGTAAIVIYAVTSNQEAIISLKRETRDLRRQLLRVDIDVQTSKELTFRNLKLSFALLGRVTAPTLLSVPAVLLVAIWLDVHQGYESPSKGQTVTIQTVPEKPGRLRIKTIDGHIVGDQSGIHIVDPSSPIAVFLDNTLVYEGNPFIPAIPVVGKKVWWKGLLGSPAGDLHPDAAIDEIHFGMPERVIFASLPDWASGWELPFFLAVFASAFGIKMVFRIG